MDDLDFDVKLLLDVSNYLRGMAAAEKAADKLEGAGKGLFKTLKDGAKGAGQALEEFKSLVTGVAGKIAALATSAAAVLGGISVTKMIEQTLDYNDSLNKMRATFGEFSADAEKFVSDFGSAVGRSKNQLTGMLGTIQGMLTGIGIASGVAAGFSQQLTELAVDVATFHNANDTEVLEDFRAALAGSERAVQKYGVFMTDAAMNAELFRMGIQGGLQAASDQEKVLARLNLLVQGTAVAHGEAARNAGSLGEAIKGVKGIVEDLSIEFGQQLVTAAEEAIKSLGGFEKVREILKTVFQTLTTIGLKTIELGVSAVTTFDQWNTAAGGSLSTNYKMLATLEQIKVGLYGVGYVAKSIVHGINVTVSGLYSVFASLVDIFDIVANSLTYGLGKALVTVTRGVVFLLDALQYITPDALGGEAINDAAGALDEWANSMESFSQGAKQNIGKNVDELAAVWDTNFRAVQKSIDQLDFSGTEKAINVAADKSSMYWEMAAEAARNYTIEAQRAQRASEEAAASAANLLGMAGRGASNTFINPDGSMNYEAVYQAREGQGSRGEGLTLPGRYDPSTGYDPNAYGPWNQAQERAEGGSIWGPAGGDAVPMWGRAGEFVVTRAAASDPGNRAFLQALNAGRASAPSGGDGGGIYSPPMGLGGGTTSQAGGIVIHQKNEMHFHKSGLTAAEVFQEASRQARRGIQMGGA